MAGAPPWRESHKEILRRAILEKEMPVCDLLRLFPDRTEASIRCQLRRQGLPCISEAQAPDMAFFESYPTPKRG